jgi:hypothetical protein
MLPPNRALLGMQNLGNLGVLFIVVTALGGCQTQKPLYYWGSYPNVVYAAFRAPDKASPHVQIETLTADIEKARATGQVVPPGLRAQLGYAHLKAGRPDLAQAYFEAEKQAFPESAIFMNRLIAGLSNP